MVGTCCDESVPLSAILMFVEYLPLLRIEPAYGIPWVSVSLLGDSHRCLSFSPDDLLLVLNFVDDRLSLSASPPQLHFGCLQRRIAVTHPVHPQQISEAGRDDRSRLLVILVRSVTLVPVDPKIPTGGTYNWVVVWTTLVLDLGTTSKQNLFVWQTSRLWPELQDATPKLQNAMLSSAWSFGSWIGAVLVCYDVTSI